MTKIIQCLQSLAQEYNVASLAKSLEMSYLEILALIAEINQLEANLIVATDSGKRFKLTRKLDWFKPDVIQQQLSELELSQYTVTILDTIDSTNTYVLNHRDTLADKTVITTELQLQGRGRGDRIWQSKIATDLTVSILYFFADDFEYEVLPLVVAIGINRLLKEQAVRNLIKWPNDIFAVNGSKIAGVLIESQRVVSSQAVNKRCVVLGIGLDNQNIEQVDRSALLCQLIKHVDNVINEYTVFGFALLRQEWLDNCIHLHKQVTLHLGDKLIAKGKHVDIGINGRLMIETNNGLRQEFNNPSCSLKVVN